MILNYFNIVLHLGFYQNRKVKYNKLVQRLFEKITKYITYRYVYFTIKDLLIG